VPRRNRYRIWLGSLAGGRRLRDTPKGRGAYRNYLGWIVEEVKAGREKEYLELSKGWREKQWQSQLHSLLKRLSPEERSDPRSSVAWKAAVAWCMKSRTDATNGRLEAALSLGSPTYVGKQAGLPRDGRLGTTAVRLIRKLRSKD